MSDVCLKFRGLILGDTVVCAVWYVLVTSVWAVWWRAGYVRDSNTRSTRFEKCRRQNKLNVNLENYAFRWFVLYNCVTMLGATKHYLYIYIYIYIKRKRALPYINKYIYIKRDRESLKIRHYIYICIKREREPYLV